MPDHKLSEEIRSADSASEAMVDSLEQRVRDYVAARMMSWTVNGEKQQIGFVPARVVLQIADRIGELEKQIHDRATCPDCGETFTTTPFAVMEEERDAARSALAALSKACREGLGLDTDVPDLPARVAAALEQLYEQQSLGLPEGDDDD